MNFIERILGFSPDSNSGTLEFLMLMIPIASVGIIVAKLKLIRSKRT
jgi:hypothetical protein